jgi:hypothetical protein
MVRSRAEDPAELRGDAHQIVAVVRIAVADVVTEERTLYPLRRIARSGIEQDLSTRSDIGLQLPD